MTRLLWQAENKMVSMARLHYKVQGGVTKADGPTVREASRTSGFVCPQTLSKLLVLSTSWQAQLPLI